MQEKSVAQKVSEIMGDMAPGLYGRSEWYLFSILQKKTEILKRGIQSGRVDPGGQTEQGLLHIGALTMLWLERISPGPMIGPEPEQDVEVAYQEPEPKAEPKKRAPRKATKKKAEPKAEEA